MTGESSTRRKEKSKATLIFVPGGQSGATKTLMVSSMGLVAIIVGLVVIICASTVLVLVLTPAGAVLPIGHPEIEKRYGAQVREIQEQLKSLLDEMVVLRAYNVRLRKALGERELPDTVTGRASETIPRVPNRSSTELVYGQEEQTRDQRLSTANAPVLPASDMIRDMQPAVRVNSGIEFPLTQPTIGFVTRTIEPEVGHLGIDIAGKVGTPIVAAADGIVVFADWTYEYGFTLIISHAGGYTTVYKHAQSLLKNVGTSVRRGEMVALLGNTGITSSGPHLHFELWRDGVPMDPEHYLLNYQ